MKKNQVHFRAEITIQEGKIEEFKKLVQVMSRMVEANEPDRIHYQFSLTSSQTMCIINEIYANLETVFAHINGVASQTILPKVFSISRISKFDVYGNPNQHLQKVLKNFDAETYNLFTGFNR